MSNRRATIDIGTNTVLLLVVEGREGQGDGLKVLREEAQITRLGEGLHRNPIFLPQAQERTLNALLEYAAIIQAFGVDKVQAVGTAAFRKAKNASEFVERVHRETGIFIQIISGEEEARLSYASAIHDFGSFKNLAVLDIGGGSTEVITKSSAVSFDLGGVVLTEKIIRYDPPSSEEVEELSQQIQNILDSGWDQLEASFERPVTLIGLAGSVTTLSAIQQGLVIWDGFKVQGSKLSLQDIERMIALFRSTTNAEKRKIPGMVTGREDTILSGTLILKNVMEKLGTDEVVVSDRGLRYGLLYV